MEANQKATELLLKPVHETLEAFRTRLGEVEQQRAVMTNELANQVRNVQATGERLRVETRALVTALRKPHVRGNWGEQQLKRVVELAGMVEHCDFVAQQMDAVFEDLDVAAVKMPCVSLAPSIGKSFCNASAMEGP